MSLHCFVTPQALAAHVTRLSHRLRHAPGVGHHVAAHTRSGAIPHAAPAAAPPVSCSAPVQALKALRALAGTPAAALVAGGMSLGAAGAGLAGGGLGAGAPAYPLASVPASNVGSSVVPNVTRSAVPAPQAAAFVVPSQLTLATTPQVTPQITPQLTSDTPPHADVPNAPASVPEPSGLGWVGLLAAACGGLAARRASRGVNNVTRQPGENEPTVAQ